MDILFELTKLGFVGLVAAVFSSYIANRNFRSQRWWERRADAYVHVIEALSDMLDYYNKLIRAALTGKDLSEGREKELDELFQASHVHVRRATDSGAFLFSTRAAEALAELNRYKPERDASYSDYLGESFTAVKTCLDTVVDCSKEDLAVSAGLFGWIRM
jgi:hypothetical protein